MFSSSSRPRPRSRARLPHRSKASPTAAVRAKRPISQSSEVARCRMRRTCRRSQACTACQSSATAASFSSAAKALPSGKYRDCSSPTRRANSPLPKRTSCRVKSSCSSKAKSRSFRRRRYRRSSSCSQTPSCAPPCHATTTWSI